MSAKISLQAILLGLEMQSDESLSFLNLDTGEVETVSRDLLSTAEEWDAEDEDESPDIPGWQEPEWETALRIVASDRFKPLPTQHDINEWRIMEDFAYSVTPKSRSRELLDAIHGSGAFRHFKSTIRRLNIEKAWCAFRDEALCDIAIEWCEEYGLEWK